MLDHKFFHQEYNLEFWEKCNAIKQGVDKLQNQPAVTKHMKENGEIRQKCQPNDNDFSQNAGMIFAKFDYLTPD